MICINCAKKRKKKIISINVYRRNANGIREKRPNFIIPNKSIDGNDSINLYLSDFSVVSFLFGYKFVVKMPPI